MTNANARFFNHFPSSSYILLDLHSRFPGTPPLPSGTVPSKYSSCWPTCNLSDQTHDPPSPSLPPPVLNGSISAQCRPDKLSCPVDISGSTAWWLFFFKVAPRIQCISLSCSWQASAEYINTTWDNDRKAAENVVFCCPLVVKVLPWLHYTKSVAGEYSKGDTQRCSRLDTLHQKRSEVQSLSAWC